jgi:hypothetical protein
LEERRCCPVRTRASAKRDSPTGSRGGAVEPETGQGSGSAPLLLTARRPVPGHLSGAGRGGVPLQVGRGLAVPDI